MSIILDGTNGISAANVFGRNVIINGDGRINQRGYTSGTATSGAGQYTLDRWKVVTSGQNLTFTGDDSRRVMTAPAGGVEQIIEDKNIVGGTYVINWDGTATATVNGSAVSKGGTFNLPANTNATVRFTGGTFTDVQVEAGSVATPFERRPYGTELALCQRYFQTITGTTSTNDFVASGFTGTNHFNGGAILKTSMRAAPTISINGSISNLNYTHPAVAATVSSIASTFSNTESYAIVANSAAATTNGNGAYLRIVATGTAVFFSSEL